MNTTTDTRDLLREAARALRMRAEMATPGPWRTRNYNSRGWGKDDLTLYGKHGYLVRPDSHGGMFNEPADATYAAAMHPGVALALADWLDAEAQERSFDPAEHDGTPNGHAARLANQILGGAHD